MNYRALALWLATAASALAAAGCPTLQYREIQRDFEQAVVADNRQLPPVADRSDQLYAEVAASLTAQYIEAQDEKLRANAWLLRSFSLWRSGALAEARASAQKGLSLNPVAGSRDAVLLRLMPALVIDSEITASWTAVGRVTDPAQYSDRYERDFTTALQKLADALESVGPATPDSTTYYVEYQRWRIIQNWRDVIASIAEREARVAAKERARANGEPLEQAAKNAKDAVPRGHFLHQQIVAAGG